MYVEVVPNRGSKPAILLRESFREGDKVRKRTVGNISSLPMDQVEAIRRVLRGEKLVPIHEVFEIVPDGSRHHGHVSAVLTAMQRLGFSSLIASKPSRERDLVVAMVMARILEPQSKLSTPQWWHTTTLPETLDVGSATEDDLYAAMDWLLERQDGIEQRLAARHLHNDALALYDLSSSYFEGTTCPLAALGHNRDGKKGKLQVNYGLLTNRAGTPVAVSVFKGNTGDPKTLLPQVDKVQKRFGIERFVLVGDRGMLTQKQVDEVRGMEGVDWIGALRPEAIKKLLGSGAIQMGLFDERNLFELTHPDFPGERLVACYNRELAHRRASKRESLLVATKKELEKIQGMVRRGLLDDKGAISERVDQVLGKYKIGKYYKLRLRDDGFDYEVDEQSLLADLAQKSDGKPELLEKRLARARRHIDSIARQLEFLQKRLTRGGLHGKGEIGLRVGKVINKYKVGKHFKLDIREASFDFEIDQDKVSEEAALDGIYVVRTGLPHERMDAAETVRSYKLLSNVERAFRSMKTVDLMVRPIHHRLEDRVRAHIFLCMLAYYVQWHMREALRPLLYADEDQEAKIHRDPVAPARRSEAALEKARTKHLPDGTRVFSFRGLLHHLASLVRNTCRRPGAGADQPTFHMDTPPNAKQQRAFDLLSTIAL